MTREEKLRVLWDKGRNYFASFFKELADVQKEMSPKAFEQWCWDDLRISAGTVQTAAGVLKEVDAKRVKHDFARAKAAEQLRRETARAAHRAAKAQARAAEKARVQMSEEEAKRQEKLAKKRATDTARREKNRAAESGETTFTHVGKSPNVVQMPDVELAAQIRKAHAKTKEGRTKWIEGSLELASLLTEAKERFQKNLTAFGDWLDRNGVDLSHQDRAALINLGMERPERRREILETTPRWSYRHIWEDVKRGAL